MEYKKNAEHPCELCRDNAVAGNTVVCVYPLCQPGRDYPPLHTVYSPGGSTTPPLPQDRPEPPPIREATVGPGEYGLDRPKFWLVETETAFDRMSRPGATISIKQDGPFGAIVTVSDPELERRRAFAVIWADTCLHMCEVISRGGDFSVWLNLKNSLEAGYAEYVKIARGETK